MNAASAWVGTTWVSEAISSGPADKDKVTPKTTMLRIQALNCNTHLNDYRRKCVFVQTLIFGMNYFPLL
jgi:hypothetical protein